MENVNLKSKKSPYRNFIQKNNSTEVYLKEQYILSQSPVAYSVYMFLTHHMDNLNAVMCSYQLLQEALNKSYTTIYRAVKFLKENNVLAIYKSGSSNVYCINKIMAWKSWGSNYEYAKFEAHIILSKKEQEELSKIKTMKTQKTKKIIKKK